MSVTDAVYTYILRMIKDLPGMKVLLLDSTTTAIVSMVFSQSEILSREVFLVDRIDNASREKMMHLKAVVFVRPTEENARFIEEELKSPHYSEYHLYFSTRLEMKHLDRLAMADESELVREVQEYYADFFPVTSDLFSLGLPGTLKLQVR